jgi:S-adenosylmethionine decarboxylase
MVLHPAADGSMLKGTWPVPNQEKDNTSALDHFTVRNGIEFAGTHLIIDLWGARHLDNLGRMEKTLRRAVAVAGATLLHIHLHHFTPNGGISGVGVLAESHISVHTWPERDYAAFDIFMCGEARPELAIPVLKEAFHPESVDISEHLRGICPERP